MKEATESPKDAALKLALEALERYQIKRQDFDTFTDVITAIKESLAPTSTLCEVQDELCSSQEPVEDVVAYHSDGTRTVRIAPKRPWVGLTFAEICEAEVAATKGFNNFSELKFARVIEAKLKAVNGFLKEKNT